MDRKILCLGLLILKINRIVVGESIKTGSQETSFSGGITITQQHVDLAKALVDRMFSYKERHFDQAQTAKIEANKIETTVLEATPKALTRVGVVPNCFPFVLQQKDNFTGFEVDLLKLIAEEESLNFTFQFINRTEMDQKFRDKVIDLAIGIWLKDADTEKNFEFSSGYLNVDLGAVTRKKHKGSVNEKLSFVGKKTGVLGNTYLENYIRSARIQDVEIVTFDATGEMLEALLGVRGEQLDLALVDKNTAQHWIAKNPELKYTSLNMAKEHAFCVAKGSPLLKAIDGGIGRIVGTQKFVELKRRWSIGEN
ncbi:MAG: transporter substrate-binding domain-containing protein [Puniceicoccales bacterium]|jgi:ABC-type amino acid transport substrate-binding protein|nr:transporter substrate-binding domain-containing protein [Puniceicoccales bacterium]